MRVSIVAEIFSLAGVKGHCDSETKCALPAVAHFDCLKKKLFFVFFF